MKCFDVIYARQSSCFKFIKRNLSFQRESKQICFVTGAGIGIGNAICKAFALSNYHVIATDILSTEGSKLVSEIQDMGGSAEFHHLDVRMTSDANDLIHKVISKHTHIDCIVANAGIAHRVPLSDLTDQKWDETFEIDLKGMLRVIRPALPSMKERGKGSIICTSSLMGLCYGWDEHVHYSAAKAGVIGFTRGLAVELARDGIRVNAIVPGYIRTAQLLSEEHSLGAAGVEKAAEFIPLGRVGEPDDIADVALFLASDKARYITGQALVVDGGLSVGRY